MLDDDDILVPPLPYKSGGKEITAISHLYRGEVYRSTIWRTRLDTTTNWAVVTTSIALSATFASPQASVLPLLLVGLLVMMFLILETRRYRYFNVWRVRTRLLELGFFVPLLRGEEANIYQNKGTALSDDYEHPQFHIGYWRAFGKRLRRNYVWIFIIQLVAYVSKLTSHSDEPVNSFEAFFNQADLGLLPGEVTVALGLLFHGFWIGALIATYLLDRNDHSTVNDLLEGHDAEKDPRIPSQSVHNKKNP